MQDTMTPNPALGQIYYKDGDGNFIAVDEDHPLPTSGGGTTGDITIAPGDVQIGAVEIKDGATDQRAVVDGTGQVSVKDAAVIAAVDGLEGLLGTTNAGLASIDGHVDGLEGKLDTLHADLGSVDGHVDGLEALLTAANAALATIDGHVDGVEGLLTLHSGYLDGLEGKLDAINTTLGSSSALEAPTFVGATTNNVAALGDPSTISIPTDNAQAGDILILWGAIRTQDALLPAGFTQLQAPVGTGDTAFTDFFIYYKFLTGTEPNTMILDLSAAPANGVVGAIVYRGVDNTTPFNVNSGEQVSLGAIPATPDPNVTTGGDSTALVLGAANSGSNANIWTYGAVAPMVERVDDSNGRCTVFAYEAPVVPGANNLPNITPSGTVATTFGLITLVFNPGEAPAASDAGTATTNTDVVVDATAGGVVILAANAHRKGFIIQNTGADNVRVSIGSNPTATHGIQLRAGESFSMAAPKCPTGLIKAIREGANSSACAAIEVV